ncbi:MAG: sulfatase-like hydrolase/transferase, partial [Pirellulaceae bacterium]|nr:sulfatase-like hydrolase/transferase [Pirellulaceae bacterium]
VHTPVLDQLMGESLRLSHHYAGSPVCSPSRAALLTGRYPIRTGAITPQETLGMDRIALSEVTIADTFRAGSYATGMVGKWHNGALDPRFHPNARGFDEFAGFRGGWQDYYDWRLDRNGSFEKADGRYLTDVLAEEAIGFIRRHTDEPFFLAVPFNAPHSPLQAPEDAIQPYLDAGLSKGVSITYAMIEIMDRGVGRILEELDRNGLSDNTIVMFTSDNGPAFMLRDDQVPPGVSIDTTRFNCGYNGAKGSVYEGGIRVPMIMRWPDGLPPAREITEQIHFIDWLPTLLAATGLNRSDGLPLDGRNVLPALRNESTDSPPPRFWQWNNYSPIGTSNAAMRDGDWKLVRPVIGGIAYATAEDERIAAAYIRADIEYKYHPENITGLLDEPEPDRRIPEPPAPELYNVAEDPLERRNLAAEDPDRMGKMLSELDAWFDDVESERRRIPSA